jgi:chorismate mutase
MIDADRRELDRITSELVGLVARRTELTVEIGRAKRLLGIDVVDKDRERRVIAHAMRLARRKGADQRLIGSIMKLLISNSRSRQHGRSHWRGARSGRQKDS